ncbi:cytosine permease [Glutamicibacter endophyticus]|uniref:purine-cytosine permease family protein n=1 Tax=Glutamicibacter sp. PS TaxID=3075634 RepID=UPI00283B5EDB|nr:cytosine permease [Glutamicibacter sp. PS]MDR4534970.1 cytosine permease [Glutamicibacter sp. PS]
MSMIDRLERRLNLTSDDSGPIRGTLSLGRIGMIWLAANLVVTTMLTGTLFVPSVSWGATIGLIVLGTVAGALVLITIGNIGTRTGLPTMALTRGAFGIRGSYLPVAANLIVLMGWSWVQAMLAGVTVDYLVHSWTGYSNPILFSVLSEIIVVILAIRGHEGIAKIEPWLAVIMLAIMGWIFFTIFSTFTPGDLNSLPAPAEEGMTGGLVFDVVFATAISWTVLSADINRTAKSPKSGMLGSGIGYIVSTVSAMALGATVFAYVLKRGDEAIAFDPGTVVSAFGAPIAIVIFFSVMATNTMVVFGMTTSLVNARAEGNMRFLPAALVLGLISILGSTFLGLLDSFTNFMILIGSFFVPVFAIMIVDYYFIARAAYSRDILRASSGAYWYSGGFNPIAICSWVVGAALSYALAYLWPSPIGATLPTFVVTFLLYLLLSYGRKNKNPIHQSHLAA